MLKDMKRDAADEKAEMDAYPADNEGQYPYGLCISLDKDELDKLGMKTLPKIGTEFHGEFIGCVTRLSEVAGNGMNGGEDRSMSIQITMLDMAPEKEQPGEKDTPKVERRESTTLLGSY
jgi:hypothetical protein